jgi:hypothetical protein
MAFFHAPDAICGMRLEEEIIWLGVGPPCCEHGTGHRDSRAIANCCNQIIERVDVGVQQVKVALTGCALLADRGEVTSLYGFKEDIAVEAAGLLGADGVPPVLTNGCPANSGGRNL